MGQEQSAEKQAKELQFAAWTGDVRKVKSLLERGANPNPPIYYPLRIACKYGNLEIVKVLVEAGADTGRWDDRGSSPVHSAVKYCHKEVLVYLIRDCKCSADTRDKNNNTPLHYACYWGHLDVVQYLVEEAHCDINVRNNNNQTVLHAACRPYLPIIDLFWSKGGSDQLAVVKYLVEKANCDINATNDQGRTPLDLATCKDNDYKDVVDYLKTRQESSRQPGKDGVGSQTAVPLTQDEADALQKLLEGAQVTIGHPIVAGTTTLEDVQQLLTQRGLEIMAGNLRTRLRQIMTEQQRNLEILNNLMTDEDTIDISYPRLFLVGPPSVGKTTTLNRLLGEFENIDSAGDKAKLRSTLLANCKQILAFVNENTAKWLSSKDVDEETKLLFGYLRESETTPNKKISIATSPDSPVLIRMLRTLFKYTSQLFSEESRSPLHQATAAQRTTMSHQRSKLLPIKSELQQLIKNADYSKMADFLGDILLNIHDIGGQPGFLEMLPALSTGPAMYLVFLDLSKELDKLYKIPFSRDGMEIIPFNSVHTTEATISQILTSIASVHCISRDPTPLIDIGRASDALNDRIKTFKQVKPVAALIGTHKDKLTDPERQIIEKNEALKKIIKKFPEIIISPGSQEQNIEHSEPLDGARTQLDSKSCFFSVDNLNGTEVSDIGPVRNFLSRIILSRFKNASLPIRPKWLIFGLLLRKQFQIATIEECFELGEMLEMQKEEVKVCLWYLHNCVGTILHYTNVPGDDVPDVDSWLKGHVICTLQAIFDSISQFILLSMRTLHSGGPVTDYEQAELVKKGQFSIKSIEMCCRNVEISELIPAKHLIKLLEHVKLLSPISHKDKSSAEVVRTTYLMPAVLECASREELVNPPPPDTNNPEPLHITFSFGYVPTGVFCGLITRLVSQGRHGILGLTWKLVEDGVKRNCVSFLIAKSNKITLISHERSYEIRVTRNHARLSLHDLCTYVLSVVLYTLTSMYKQLVPQVAFQCPCPGHSSSRDRNSLCILTEDVWIQFLCGSNPVTLRKEQTVWLGKTKKVGEEAELEVLKFSKDSFSFHWIKEGQIKTTDDRPNTLSFPSVKEEDFGHYQCEVKDAAAGKVLLTLYTALYKEEPSEFSTEKNEEPKSNDTKSIVKTPSSDEGSLSSESLQYSAAPVQRVGTTSAGEDSQVRTRRGSPANRAPLQGLINHYSLIDEQLNSEIKKADTPFIAEYFDNAELYSSAMGLTPAEQADVKRLYHSEGVQTAMMKCLQVWKQHNSSRSTYRALLDIVLRLGKGDTADKICQQLTQHRTLD
ncbi:uncharacterized protein LOC135337431 isoform X7 [Halichondria panicea]|uniref:uncharacterized protein LOC135337431 isoform X7 n=1 Tax=Halichondria panicea TaxID=6063 RepID=UPI00312BA015